VTNIQNILFQYLSEKMGKVEGSKVDEDFLELERVSWFSNSINTWGLMFITIYSYYH
jgi:hypothetical protein